MTAWALACALAAALAAGDPFTIDALAPGVDLYRGDPGRGYANSLVVDRGDGLLVVDAQPSPAAAKELLAAIAARAGKPVRYLVFSHPHVEAIGGASAFPAGAVRVGSGGCARSLADASFDVAAEARARAARPEAYALPPVLGPVLTVEGPAALEAPPVRVELYPLPAADTEGDLLVVLPEHGIAYVGDLYAADRNPFAGQASVDGWIVRLNAVASMAPKVVVALRGPAVDATALRRQRDAFAWVKGQISKCYVDLVPVAEMPDRVLALPDAAKWFDTEARPSFLRGVIDTVIREAEAQRRKRGLP